MLTLSDTPLEEQTIRFEIYDQDDTSGDDFMGKKHHQLFCMIINFHKEPNDSLGFECRRNMIQKTVLTNVINLQMSLAYMK